MMGYIKCCFRSLNAPPWSKAFWRGDQTADVDWGSGQEEGEHVLHVRSLETDLGDDVGHGISHDILQGEGVLGGLLRYGGGEEDTVVVEGPYGGRP